MAAVSWPLQPTQESIAMGSTSEYDARYASLLPEVARRVQEFMNAQNPRLKHEKAARMFTRAALELGERRKITRRRLSKILACRLEEKPGASRARSLQRHELRAFAHAGVPIDDLIQVETDIVCWDALSNDRSARDFYERLAAELVDTAELLSWAEFLPCSLETKTFMEKHHESLFSEHYDYPDELEKVLQKFNAIGNHRRKALLDAGKDRPWKFTHILFESDLAKISDLNAPEYCCCPPATRHACLRNLAQLIKQPSSKITLVVVKDAAARSIKKKLHDYDSLVVLFNQSGAATYAFRRTHTGDISCTKRKEELADRRKSLENLRNLAAWDSSRDFKASLDLLNHYITRSPK
jgi:hypothetical protein